MVTGRLQIATPPPPFGRRGTNGSWLVADAGDLVEDRLAVETGSGQVPEQVPAPDDMRIVSGIARNSPDALSGTTRINAFDRTQV